MRLGWHIQAWLCIGIFVGTDGMAQVAAQGPESAQRPVVEQFLRKFGPGWKVRPSADGRRLVSAVGLGTRAYGDKPEPAAREFLRENAALFGLRPDLGDLRVLSQVATAASGHVEFEQVVRGLPVENARVRVNLTRDGKVLEVKNGYLPVEAPAERPLIGGPRAVETAIQEFLRLAGEPAKGKDGRQVARGAVAVERSAMQLEREPRADDIYFVTEDGLRRAYRVLVRSRVPLGVKEFVVDAETGRILRTVDLVAYDQGTARVFIPNPVNSLNNNNLTDTNYATQANANNDPNPYYTRQLLDLAAQQGGKYRLTGPFATIEEIENPTHAAPSETTSSFTYHRGDANYDDAMAYYHIDLMQRYIQLLGFVNINNRQIRIDTYGLQGDPNCNPDGVGDCDNSHHVGDGAGTGYLAFGRGGVDDAEDAEIIAHEYGHAIQDNTRPKLFSTGALPRAMGEGFSDYWAMSMYSAETVANGHTLACIGEWDATSYSNANPPCLRRVDDNVTTANYSSTADEHVNGPIWSRTLWDVFQGLGKTTTDRLVLQSHFNVPSSITAFKDGGDAMLTADMQLFGGSHLSQLCQVFLARGVYAADDCPVLPSNTGAQSTTVVLARFNDSGLPASPMTSTDVTTLVNTMSAYLSEVSHSDASLGTPSIKGWVDLNQSRAHYYDETSHNPLIDLVKDTVAAVTAADSTFDFSAVDRLFIITNDDYSGGETRGQKEWATTGPWPYKIPTGAKTRRFSASVHSYKQTAAQFDHALGHHFGMFDLYAHEGVTFPRPYADGWSNMAKDSQGNFNNVHFFAWDKMKPGWLDGTNVTFIPRPPADPDANHKFEQTYSIYRQETAAANPVVIQVGTTEHVTQRNQERVSYYIEARAKSGTYDGNLPSDAVLIYYVNEDIGQGFGPLRLVDATPSDSDLTNAGLLPSTSTSKVIDIDSTGLTVEVLTKTGAEDYRVHVTYDPPETQNDVWIHAHDTNWKSEDIWVDSPACNAGTCDFDKDKGREEKDRGDKPKPGTTNRLYARVYNQGPATAHNVSVDFYVSEPYHAVDGAELDPDTGSNIAFNKHYVNFIGDLAPTGTAGKAVYVEWTPTKPSSGTVHTCVKVRIPAVFNDTNAYNQASQENITEYDLTSSSPYPPAVDDFKVVNPYDHPILVYLRADDVPEGWTAGIVPSKAYLPVGGSVDAQMTIQAPLTYPVCSTEFVKATGWYVSGDTLTPLGASVAQVNLKKSTALKVQTSYSTCSRKQAVEMQKAETVSVECRSVNTKGCTDPPRPYEHITLTYTGPDGKPVYHDVVTDQNGCFEDFLMNAQGGAWSVRAEYQGDVCTAPAEAGTQTVQVPGGAAPVPWGRGLWYSFHLGLNAPVGAFKRGFDPGPSLTVNAEYLIRDNLSVMALLGFHAFGGTPAHFSYGRFAVNARVYTPAGWARLYAQAGPGVYFPNTGSTAAGANVGAGLSFPVLPKLRLEAGPDLHFVNDSAGRRVFVDAKLGIAFRF